MSNVCAGRFGTYMIYLLQNIREKFLLIYIHVSKEKWWIWKKNETHFPCLKKKLPSNKLLLRISTIVRPYSFILWKKIGPCLKRGRRAEIMCDLNIFLIWTQVSSDKSCEIKTSWPEFVSVSRTFLNNMGLWEVQAVV